MKILLIGPASPFRGGIANFNDSLYTALEKNHEPGIIGFTLQYPSFLFPGKSQYVPEANIAKARSKQLINSVNPLSWRVTVNDVVKSNPELLIVHYWMPFFAPVLGTVIRWVKHKIHIPVIGILHNVEPHEGMPGGKILARYFFKSCDGFITMSSKVLNDLKNSGIHKPVKQIPHPLYEVFGEQVSRYVACKYLKLDPAKKYLLFFGIIRNYKGLDLLLETLTNNKISHINLTLIVAGEFYEKEERYLDMVEKLGLENKIIFVNKFIPQEEVRYYFAASDLVVLPYLSATQSGITQIAYHFDKPMLVTNVGGLKEVVPHGKVGYVCERDPDEIASAIADFFDNCRSEEFVENTKAEKRRFSWDAMVQGIEQLTEEIK